LVPGALARTNRLYFFKPPRKRGRTRFGDFGAAASRLCHAQAVLLL
jgi:hypothetical protein